MAVVVNTLSMLFFMLFFTVNIKLSSYQTILEFVWQGLTVTIISFTAYLENCLRVSGYQDIVLLLWNLQLIKNKQINQTKPTQILLGSAGVIQSNWVVRLMMYPPFFSPPSPHKPCSPRICGCYISRILGDLPTCKGNLAVCNFKTNKARLLLEPSCNL